MSIPLAKVILVGLKHMQVTQGSKALMQLNISEEQAELLNLMSADSLDYVAGDGINTLFNGFDLNTDIMKKAAEKSVVDRRHFESISQMFLADACNDMVCEFTGYCRDKVIKLRASYGYTETRHRAPDDRPVEVVIKAIEAEYCRYDERIQGEKGVKGLVLVAASNTLNMPINALYKKLKLAISLGKYSWPVCNSCIKK